MDVIARLAVLVPKPRVNLTRFHGAARIIACIEDPAVIEKILRHLDSKAAATKATRRPPCRAPPQTRLFD